MVLERETDLAWEQSPATTSAEFPTNAWLVHFFDGDVFTGTKAIPFHVWCVRSGHHDGSEY